MDPENRRVVGNVLVLQNVDATVFDILVGDLRNCGCVRDTRDEEQCGENHSSFDCDRKICKHREPKGHQPNADVGLGQLEQLRNFAPFAHVVCDDHQDPCQRCHWIIPPDPKSVDDQTPIIPAPSDAYRSVPLRPPERNM